MPQNDNMIAKVLIATTAQQLDKLFDYQIPDDFRHSVKVGARIIVPFQNRLQMGYVWEITDTPETDSIRLKEIRKVLDDPPLLSSVHFQLINWISDYYFCSRADVARLCFPPGQKTAKEESYRVVAGGEELRKVLAANFTASLVETAVTLLQKAGSSEWSRRQWEIKFKNHPDLWAFLISHQIVVPVRGVLRLKQGPKLAKIYQWCAETDSSENAAGSRVKEVLRANPSGVAKAELCAAAAVSSSVLDRLARQGKIKETVCQSERRPIGFEALAGPECETVLNHEQYQVYKQVVSSEKPRTYVLRGITGSGKTEVYFEIAAAALERGKQVLYLVPEISLTPQTLERIRKRFGDQVALLHSNMSDGERFDQWCKVKSGEARIVLGARSALFAPVENLGLIIIDEEHENTYKQEESPRYHTHRVAQKLAELTGSTVILGSATPSIDSFYKANESVYALIQLTERYNNYPLPEVQVVDMRDELKSGNRNVLSRPLFQAIAENLANKEQVLLLLNRRGYATFVLCRDCGQALRCPSCDVSLTYHQNETVLRCHYCDYRTPVPDLCPGCQSSRIRYFGHGTQKLEEELAAAFPGVRMIRMDVDTTSKKGAHHHIYQQLRQGAADILLGTQMIAKGLDLPEITLVGVISADSMLNIPDFRAAERTFQLLTQVAGRAGRGRKPGRVIFQAYNPSHYSLELAQKHDYPNFFRTEIDQRRQLNYPPFSEFFKFGFSGLDAKRVGEAAHRFGRMAKEKVELLKLQLKPEATDFVEIMGPAPCMIPKIQNNFRWQLMLKTNNPAWLHELVNAVWREFPFRNYSDIRFSRDRNPYSIV